jgi:hypothetical protein
MAIISISATRWWGGAAPPARPPPPPGLANQAAWTALARKGLIKSMFPHVAVLTPAGLAYDTGLGGAILRRAEH